LFVVHSVYSFPSLILFLPSLALFYALLLALLAEFIFLVSFFTGPFAEKVVRWQAAYTILGQQLFYFNAASNSAEMRAIK